MLLRQYPVQGLGHASYLIGSPSTGECAIIDPMRDIDRYVLAAEAENMLIRHVLETHVPSDYVSGARDLAQRSGAELHLSAKATTSYAHASLAEGDELRIGEVRLWAIETPGHTPEHISFLAADTSRSDEPYMLFSGGSLLVGSVGRPDLLGVKEARALARQFFATLHERILNLADYVEVHPTHVGGSLCGKNIGAMLSTTIGYERRFNPALKIRDVQQFTRYLLSDLPDVPRYWAYDRSLNLAGPPPASCNFDPAPLTAQQVFQMLGQDHEVIDARPPEAFGGAHIPGSRGVHLRPAFATWVGSIVAHDTPLILVLERDDLRGDAYRQLVRIGYDNVAGYLQGGILSWLRAGLPVAHLPQLSVHELHERLSGDSLSILDVREESEWREAHIPGATHIPARSVGERMQELDRHGHVALICGSGFRSTVAASLLMTQGFDQVDNVIGGMSAWRQANYEIEAG